MPSTLTDRLSKRSLAERRILQVFAIVDAPMNQTDIKALLTTLDWKDDKGELLFRLLTKALQNKFVKAGFLTLSNNKMQCAEELSEVLTRQACNEGIMEAVVLAAHNHPSKVKYRRGSQYMTGASVRVLRRLREVLYLGSAEALELVLHSPLFEYHELIDEVAKICCKPFDPEWFKALNEGLQYQVLHHIVETRAGLSAEDPEYRYLLNACQNQVLTEPGLFRVLAHWRIATGQLAGVAELLPKDNHWQTLRLEAWLLALLGDQQHAITLFEKALKAARKATQQRSIYISGAPGLCYTLCLLASEAPEPNKPLEKQLKLVLAGDTLDPQRDAYLVLRAFKEARSSAQSLDQYTFLKDTAALGSEEAYLLLNLCRHWLGVSPTDAMLDYLAVLTLRCHQQGRLAWFVRHSVEFLQHYQFDGSDFDGSDKKSLQDIYSTNNHTNSHNSDIASLLSLIQPQNQWQRALQALQGLSQDANEEKAVQQAEARLVWQLLEGWGGWTLQPKEQKLGKHGRWSKGRNISLGRLYESPEDFEYLSEQDKQICRHIEKEHNYYGSGSFHITTSALVAVAGHPRVFWEDNNDKPVEVLHCDPELNVREQGKFLYLKLQPAVEDHSGEINIVVLKEGSHRLLVYQFNAQHNRILTILSPDGLRVPLNAKPEVLKSISAIAPLLSIQSDIGGGDINAKELEADAHLYMLIQPYENGMQFNLWVYPLGVDGPQLLPGDGRAMMMTEVNSERVHTMRDIGKETQEHKTLVATCTALSEFGWDAHEHAQGQGQDPNLACEWHLGGEDALEALYQLQHYGEPLVLLWPKGGRIKLNSSADVSSMRVSVRQEKDWFALEGELNLDDGQILSIAKLMALTEQSQGRFVALGDDEFILLTQQLRQRLEGLRRHGEHQRFHPLATTALEELTQGMELEAAPQWLQQKERIEQACALNTAVPDTLEAQLRDYQYDGFNWLTRLAHWGAGACLADDMGLGKTVQSLALILTRAAEGPTLILAPTSVSMNWLSEATRFAPTLNTKRFGTGDRGDMLKEAGPFDLIVCSYGLLQTEISRLKDVQWHTIIADEAQALKNPQTKRSQAAMNLQGDFKMITTGTPIENHLGELWTLFRFINPGLLGSLDSFNKRFAVPIENKHDDHARQHLKRLVQPFILRRLKREVLSELPPRTEITINVPLSHAETTFYEAVRRQAIDKLAKADNNQPGQQQLRILAEIMRLRRACCNPKLVEAGSHIPSAKLDAFGNIVAELVDNKHRALVFSQFVDHLQIIREYLDGQGIRYQYLDGSTSFKQREKAVNAFQNGEGDLFLISLKAGGSGLNLTAADYVVHMDPWWNPAVEDQASDRAHRLGQKRPVTIYRLVAENTIEQKIIALHSQKRDLADSLLEGSDMSGKLSAKEIMGLIAN